MLQFQLLVVLNAVAWIELLSWAGDSGNLNRAILVGSAISVLTVCIAGVWLALRSARRIPLADLGATTVHEVLRGESSQRRQEVLDRGWVTAEEWIAMLDRLVLERLVSEAGMQLPRSPMKGRFDGQGH